MERSPIEVAILVIGGLIDGAERRATAIGRLSPAVAAAVAELDPDGLRDTRPTWWSDLEPWQHLDATDRLRLAHDHLLVLEVQAAEIVAGLQAMLTPHPVTVSYRASYRRLERLAESRAGHVERLRLAERRVRPRLSMPVAAELSAARRALKAEEVYGVRQRARLGALLSMADIAAAS